MGHGKFSHHHGYSTVIYQREIKRNGKSNEEKNEKPVKTVKGESNVKRMLLAQSLSMSNKKRELALTVYDVTSQLSLYFVDQ